MSDKKEIGYAVLVDSEEHGTLLGLGDIDDHGFEYENFIVFTTKEEADVELARALEESEGDPTYKFRTVRLYAEEV